MKTLLVAVLSSSLLAIAPAADITVIGNWSEVIDASDLSAGAGSNLVNQHTSLAGTTTVDIANTAGVSWRVFARRSDSSWNGALTLSVRRSSSGSGSGSIAGGEGFIQLTNVDTEIFAGSGDRTAISVQTQLTGMSVDIAPNAYSAGIVFTVVP